MFKKNTKHSQPELFGLFNTLPERMKKKIKQSEEYTFYKLIFCNIKEDIFSELYSEKKSRPNAPVNTMLSALILMHRYNWTYEELFKNIEFNILTKIALGVDCIEEMPFCPATLFNFQNRLSKHFAETGENLFEKVFDQLTEKQLKALKIKTNIQRTDSFAAASNIRNYTRLQLLVELVLRIFRVLSEEDKKRFRKQFDPYINKTSGQYIYSLGAQHIPHEIEKIAQLYYWIDQNLKPLYKDLEIFKTFERVYAEQFTVSEQKIEIKPAERIPSSSVQSPDDLDAVYRNKNGKEIRGQSINVVETANPENPVNLITDVSVHPANKDDSKVLAERLSRLKEKTPELEELHFDGAYGSSENDRELEKAGITPVQRGVRGPKPSVEMKIEKVGEKTYTVSCPRQSVTSTPTRKRYKAVFSLSVCKGCPLRSSCPTIKRKSGRLFYFSHELYLALKRQKAVEGLPEERRKLRCNIEATVKEFSCKMPRRKLKLRGAFKASVFAFTVAIGINFGRIFRLIQVDPSYWKLAFHYFAIFVKDQWIILRRFWANLVHLCRIRYPDIYFSKMYQNYGSLKAISF